MCQAEERGLPVRFKLRQTEGVLPHLAELAKRKDWEFVGGGWHGEGIAGLDEEVAAGDSAEMAGERNSGGGIEVGDGTAGADGDSRDP